MVPRVLNMEVVELVGFRSLDYVDSLQCKASRRVYSCGRAEDNGSCCFGEQGTGTKKAIFSDIILRNVTLAVVDCLRNVTLAVVDSIKD